jgi:hypothetical protein
VEEDGTASDLDSCVITEKNLNLPTANFARSWQVLQEIIECILMSSYNK